MASVDDPASSEIFVASENLEVLKPPGGGSSDIFGASGPENAMPEFRRNKNHQQTSSLFLGGGGGGGSGSGSGANEETDNKSTSSSASSNKPGNDSHRRLFGEPELPKTPSVKRYRMKSNIVLENCTDATDVYDKHHRHLDPVPLNANHNNNSSPAINGNGCDANANNNKSLTNTSSSSTNTSPRSLTPRSHPSSPNGNFSPRECCGKASYYTARNPVTGDGYGFIPTRKSYSSRRKDGNPVTGEGYETAKPQSAHLSNGGSSSLQNNPAAAPRQRVPPGGFSSGLW